MNYFSIPGRKDVKLVILKPSVGEVCAKFCALTLAPYSELTKKSRVREVVKYRYALAYYLKQYTDATLDGIAKATGMADHAMTDYAIRKMVEWQVDKDFAAWLKSVDPYNGTQAIYPPVFSLRKKDYHKLPRKKPLQRPAAIIPTSERIMQRHGV